MAMWRGTVLVLTDIGAVLTVGIWERNWQGNIKSKVEESRTIKLTKMRRASSFVLRAYFVIRHSCFVISSSAEALNVERRCRARTRYRMIVSPRAGPTLTIESFAPASSEMYLTYFLAAEGSCENLRAVCVDVFQPATSS